MAGFGRRGFGIALVAAPLAGCAQAGRVLARAGITPGEAVALYQIAKGIAEVAMVADPMLVPVAAGIFAVADPLMAALQREGPAPQDVSAMLDLANALTLKTAQAITVVPNARS